MASATCIASSRVGTSTRPRGRPDDGRGAPASRWIIGSANAAVLPVPVPAWPIRSRPVSSSGIASRWMGVGSSYPRAVTALTSASPRPSASNRMEPAESAGSVTRRSYVRYQRTSVQSRRRVVLCPRQTARLALRQPGRLRDLPNSELQYIPPMPPPWGIGDSFLSSGISETIASVVSRSDAIDEAFWSAERTTLVGSMTPAFTRSS